MSSPRSHIPAGPGGRFFRAVIRLALPVWLFAGAGLGAELPPYFATALAHFSPDVPRIWAYTLNVTRGSESSVESFDPSQPPGRQWSLLERDGRPPTANEAERYVRYRETTNATTGARATFARGDLDYSSAWVVHEDAGGAVVHFRFRTDAVEPMLAHLELFLALAREPGVVRKSTLHLVQPYSPVIGMKMNELEMEMTFADPSGDQPGLPVSAVSRFHGRFLWFWSIDEETRVRYANFRRVTPFPDAAAPP